MRAAVCRQFDEPLTIEELSIDPPGPGEVGVDIRACAICGSDIHAAAGAWGGRLPAVYGHEASGVVSALGAGVDSVEIGQRVVVSLLRSCGECFYCTHDQPHLCESKRHFPIARERRIHTLDGDDVAQGVYTGSFAEKVVVHASQVAPLDDAIGFDVASLLACGVITGYGAATNTVNIPAGSTVAVIGTGGVGLNAIQGAVASAAGSVIAVDVAQPKLDDAVEFGATDTIRISDGSDPIEEAKKLTGGRGPDFVFVTVGNTAAIQQGMAMARPGGTVVVVGMTKVGDEVRVETSGFAGDNRTVVGSFMGSTDLQRDIPLLSARYLAGELKLDELITKRWSLDEINEAIESTKAGSARRNVIVFDAPDGANS